MTVVAYSPPPCDTGASCCGRIILLTSIHEIIVYRKSMHFICIRSHNSKYSMFLKLNKWDLSRVWPTRYNFCNCYILIWSSWGVVPSLTLSISSAHGLVWFCCFQKWGCSIINIVEVRYWYRSFGAAVKHGTLFPWVCGICVSRVHFFSGWLNFLAHFLCASTMVCTYQYDD